MNEIYYAPEKLGMEQIAEQDWADAYEFDMLVVWRDTDGKLRAATDSGCSCPTPFEDHTFPTDFTEIRSLGDAKGMVESDDWRDRTIDQDFLRKVEGALKAAA